MRHFISGLGLGLGLETSGLALALALKLPALLTSLDNTHLGNLSR